MRAQDLKARTDACLAESRARLDAFLALPEDTAASARIDAFDAIRRPLNEVEGWVQLHSSVHPDAALRREAEELELRFARWRTELAQHRGAYEALAAVPLTDAADEVETRFLEHTLRDFRRSGVDRDEAQRARLLELSEQLVAAGQEFDRNVVEDARELVVEDGHAGLAGLPADFVRAHPEDERGHVRVSTDPQDWIPFMSFAERADLREALLRLRHSRAYPANLDVLGRILRLRHEYATLLGHPHWASHALEELMSRDVDVVRGFIERCADLARERSGAELEELRAAEHARTGAPDAEVHEWDRQFLSEQVRRTRYAFDAQEARAYFPYASVLRGVLDVASRLYGVTFEARDDLERWHPSVRCYDVREGGAVIARFWLDMHPRAGKYKHAAMFPLVNGFRGGPLPEACLVCNFPEPTADDPGLLLHDQVTTIFHEFGHLLHHLWSNGQRFLRFSGLSTEWDFVEVPSQMFEEWAWRPEVLRGFALHHETGEPIPEDLVRRMRAADEYGRGLDVRTQMFYAALSLGLHDSDPESFDPEERMRELRARLAPFPHVDGTCFLASFTHLNGYSAIYYTYMWSLVIAKDLFSRFEPDVMREAVAREYRERVIGRGGERDASDLVRAFLGREYTTEAWERSLAG